MKIKFELHTHSEYSRFGHAKGTVEQNANRARRLGIGLGISDHGPGHYLFGMNAKSCAYQRARIDAINEKMQAESGQKGQIWVLQGVEANLMGYDGSSDVNSLHAVTDYVLIGYHRGVSPFRFLNTSFIAPGNIKKNNSKARMTDALIKAMEDKRIDAITHPGEYVPVDMAELARAAAFYGVVLELNSHHPMDSENAKIAAKNGAHFIVSSDAHDTNTIGQVDSALRTMRMASIPENRVINLEYDFNAGLRLDRLCIWACNAKY